MVAVVGAGRPGGGLGGDRGRAADAVDGLGGGERGVQGGDAGAVREEVADQDAVLAGGLELGPVGADGGVQVELAALVQQEGDGGGDALGGGADDLGGAGLPGGGRGVARLGVAVLGAAPEVDDLAAVPVDGHRRSALAALGEVGCEGVPDRLEAVLDRALDVHPESRFPLFPSLR
ncbi:hypothetical protein DC74_3603 [Streptomyces noursei]|nr:hypothetical protein DC74_3603 [Streptomyces noursei]